jgi:D-alanyl-D-alanine carboxypeptidase
MQKRLRLRRDVSAIRGLAAAALVGLLSLAVTAPAQARTWHSHHRAVAHAVRRATAAAWASATDPLKDAALIIEADSGRVLYSRNANASRYPASLTKMMTLYLLFDALKKGTVTLSSPLAVSAHAASQKPTNLHLLAGDQITVENAIKAIVIRSANDVAVVIAEGLGGTESHFAQMMTQTARQMGMNNTYYHNASGLPDRLQVTTASDLSILARHLRTDFPQYFPYFATPSFYYRGVNYITHDNLIGRYQGTEGMKTGFTVASGFNLVSCVVRNGRRLIGVVMGGRTAAKRDHEMMALLDTAFGSPGETNGSPLLASLQAQAATAPGAQDDEDGAPAAVEEQGPLPSAPTAQSTLQMASIAPAAPFTQPAVRPLPRPAQPLPQVKITLTPKPRPYTPPAPNLRSSDPIGEQIAATMRAPISGKLPNLRPRPRPNMVFPADKTKPVMVASLLRPKPSPAATVRDDLGEGDIGDSPRVINATGHSWTIQIGAYADPSAAKAQLEAYASKSKDLLGQSSHLVVAAQNGSGHKMYRARFGPFAEKEARSVCATLTKRGQTCFTVSKEN